MKTTQTAGQTLARVAPLLSVVALLAGCASEPLDSNALTAAPIETRNPMNPGGSTGTGGASSSATPQSSVATVDLSRQNAQNGMLSADQRVIYFDFDSYAIKDEYKDAIDRNARALAGQPARHVVVEGYTDDRGGREYNLALGQKRAEAVARAMTLLGATDRQVEAVSFGEERPMEQGSTESAFAKNRRAEIKDR